MAAQQLARLKARSEATCDRLQGDIFAIRQQKVPQGVCDNRAARSVAEESLVGSNGAYENGIRLNYVLPGSIKADSCSHPLWLPCYLRCSIISVAIAFDSGAADAADRAVTAGVGGRPAPA